MHQTLKNFITAAISQELDWNGFLRDYTAMTARMRQGGTFTYQGIELETGPGVYQPGPGSSTHFIADHLSALLPEPGASMLELGCGAGLLSILGEKAGLTVAASDIDPSAVQYAAANGRRNGAVFAPRLSDLFQAYQGERFDFILFNLPFFNSPRPISNLERPLADPGGRLIKRFLDEAKSYLSEDGYIAFSFANCGQFKSLERSDWDFDIAAMDYQRQNHFVRMIVTARPTAAEEWLPAAAATSANDLSLTFVG